MLRVLALTTGPVEGSEYVNYIDDAIRRAKAVDAVEEDKQRA